MESAASCGNVYWCKRTRGGVCTGQKDFISKFEIALKECNESDYWLELLFDTNCISKEEYEAFHKDCIELRRMLVSSVVTLKNRQDTEMRTK